jgi:hypothetical protein
MKKIDDILNKKEGYYWDTGNSVIIILEKPATLFQRLAGSAGYILLATEIDKQTGKETPYSLYTKKGIRVFDTSKLKHFKSFGPGEIGASLLDDLQGPRKAS